MWLGRRRREKLVVVKVQHGSVLAKTLFNMNDSRTHLSARSLFTRKISISQRLIITEIDVGVPGCLSNTAALPSFPAERLFVTFSRQCHLKKSFPKAISNCVSGITFQLVFTSKTKKQHSRSCLIISLFPGAHCVDYVAPAGPSGSATNRSDKQTRGCEQASPMQTVI